MCFKTFYARASAYARELCDLGLYDNNSNKQKQSLNKTQIEKSKDGSKKKSLRKLTRETH